MAREFKNIGQFVRFLATRPAAIEAAAHAGLNAGADVLLEEVRHEIGTYQDAIGPFPAWPELADSTKQDRVQQGYTENDPLLRSGELRDSYKKSVEGGHATVGSEEDKALWMEVGTPDARHPSPPRPVLGGSAFRKHKEIAEATAGPVVDALAGLPPSRNRRGPHPGLKE